ncbi:hypothetical protein GGP41_007872, partial [Bipolaris sorokiniana]
PITLTWVLEWILLVLVYTVIAVRIYMRRFRFRENIDVAGYLLIVSALNALALVTWDTIAYNTGALDSKVKSDLLSKILFACLPCTGVSSLPKVEERCEALC